MSENEVGRTVDLGNGVVLKNYVDITTDKPADISNADRRARTAESFRKKFVDLRFYIQRFEDTQIPEIEQALDELEKRVFARIYGTYDL